jgi:hypothetical protein
MPQEYRVAGEWAIVSRRITVLPLALEGELRNLLCIQLLRKQDL